MDRSIAPNQQRQGGEDSRGLSQVMRTLAVIMPYPMTTQDWQACPSDYSWKLWTSPCEVGLLHFTRSFLMHEEFSEKGLVSKHSVWLGIGWHWESSLTSAIKNKDLLWEIHESDCQHEWVVRSTVLLRSGQLMEFRDCMLGITTRYQDFYAVHWVSTFLY